MPCIQIAAFVPDLTFMTGNRRDPRAGLRRPRMQVEDQSKHASYGQVKAGLVLVHTASLEQEKLK